MYKVFQYRVYPSKSQARRLDSIRETCRRWYNACLEERKIAFAERKENVSKFDQIRRVKDYRASNSYAAQVHSHVLQTVAADVDHAFQAFFRRVKAGQTPGYPRFKSSNRFSSFGFKEYRNGFKIDGRRLRVHSVGRLAVRWHRPLEGTIKALRLIKKADQWYACFTCIIEVQPLSITGRDIGIDLGLINLLTTSDGDKQDNPRWYRAEQRKLRILCRRVSRRKRGGANRRKAVLQLQRQHARIANRRKDYLNKLASQFITQYDRIALEQLTIDRMVRHPRLAKSILDAGWGYFIRHLTSKAAEAGRQVCLVDPRNTSKTCSGCGHIFEELTLADRWITCTCGVSLDRDHNAAINILNRAGRVRWASNSSMDGLAQETVPL